MGLPDDTVCFVYDISIPHTWRTVESHNKFYIIFKYEYLVGGGYETTVAYNYHPYVLTLPEGNYTGANLATAVQELLNLFAVTFGFEVLYQPARGSITIEATSEDNATINQFYIPSDFGIMTWMIGTDNGYPWGDGQGNITTVEINNLQSINGVSRSSDTIAVNLESEYYRTYESGFLDLLNAHNV